jgi:WD40 repeat protein
MMIVTVSCTGCKRLLKLPAEVIGGTARCPICLTEFLTRGDAEGKVEAISLPGSGAPQDLPLLDEPLPSFEAGELPSLSLDEPVEALPPPPVLTPIEEPAPRPSPSRRGLRPAKVFPAVRFVLFVQHDPNGRLEGRFQAEASTDGLRIWRGQGRIIEVPRGSEAEHLRGARVAVEVEGRIVDFTVIHDTAAPELARQVADFLTGQADVVEVPAASPWIFAPFGLLPLGVPVLAAWFGQSSATPVGVTLWACFAVVLASLAVLFAFNRSWSAALRGGLTGLMVFLAYFVLTAGLLIDRSMKPPAAGDGWVTVTGPGYTVRMPAAPTKLVRPLPGFASFEELTLHVPVLNATYRILAGQHAAPGDPAAKLEEAIRALVAPQGVAVTARAPVHPAFPGAVGAEVRFQGPGPAAGIARVYATRSRTAAFVAQGRVFNKDFEKMAQSATLFPVPGDLAKDGPGKDGGKPPMPDGADLGNGGFRLGGEKDGYVWAGFLSSGRPVAVKERGGFVYWDRAGANPQARPSPGPDVASFGALHGTRLAIAGLNGGFLAITSLDRPGPPMLLEDELRGKSIWSVTFSPDGKKLASAHGDRKARLWDAEKGKLIRAIESGKEQALSVAFSPDGALLAVANADRKVRIHNAETGALTATCEGHLPWAPLAGPYRDWRWAVRSLSFSRDGRTLASAGNDGNVHLWDVRNGQLLRRIAVGQPVTATAFHPAGRLLASGCVDGRILFHEAASGELRGTIHRPPGAFLSLAFSPDGDQVLALRDGKAERWDWRRHVNLRGGLLNPVEALPRHITRLTLPGGMRILRMEASPDGARLALVGSDNKAHLYSGDPLRAVALHDLRGPLTGMAFSPDGKRLALGSADSTVVLDAEGGAPLATFPHQGDGSPAYAFLPDGSRLLLASGAHPLTRRPCLRVWDLATRAELPPVPGPHAKSWLALSPNGLATVACSSGSETLTLYEAATGRAYAVLKAHGRGTLRAAWSADGSTLVTLGQDGSVGVWDVASCRRKLTIEPAELGFGVGAAHLAISADGKTAAAALHHAQAVSVLDLPSGKRLATIRPPGGRVTGLALGGPGPTLSVAGEEGSVDQHDLAMLPDLQKRPPPAGVDLERQPAPQVPDLQPAALAEPHLACVIDPEGGHAILFTRCRMALHYSYPEMRLRSATWCGHLVVRAVLERKNGRVFAATVGPRSLPPRTQDVRLGHGPLISFDVQGLLEGRRPARLEARELPLAGRFTALASSGKWLFALDAKDQLKPVIRRLDLEKLEAVGTADLPFPPASMALSPDGSKLYAAGQARPGEGQVARIDPGTLKVLRNAATGSWGTSLAVSARHVLVGGLGDGGDGVALLDATKDEMPRLARWSGMSQSKVWPAGGKLYVVHRLGALRILAYPEGSPPAEKLPEAKAVYSGHLGTKDAEVSPDGRHALLCDGTLLRLSSGKLEPPKAGWPPPQGPLLALARSRGALEAPGGRVLGLAWTADGKHLVGATTRGEVIRWDVEPGGAVRRQTPWSSPASALAIAPDGRSLGVTTWGGEASLWSLPDLVPQPGLRGVFTLGQDGIAFAPNGSRLYTGGPEGLYGWARGGGTDGKTPTGAPLTGVTASRLGALAAGGVDGVARLFDAASGEHRKDLKGHEAEVRALAWSADGKRLATADVSGSLRLWDADGASEKAFQAHGAAVLAVAFSPDGKVIATGAADGSVCLWDTEGKKMREAARPRPALPAWSLAFSPDGRSLAVAEGSGVRVYSTAGVVEASPRPPADGEPLMLGRIGASNRGVLLDTGEGLGVALGSLTGSLFRFSSKDFKLERTFRLDRTVFRILFHRASGKLYAFRSGRPVPLGSWHPRGEDAAILTFNLSQITEPAKEKLPKAALELKARKEVPIPGVVFCPRLSPEGKALYWLDATGRQVMKLSTSLDGKPEALALEAVPEALALSPDGRSLYAVVEGLPGRSSLVTIDAATMKAVARKELGQRVQDVAAGAEGDVLLSGDDSLVWASAATPDRAKKRAPTGGVRYRVEASADGKLAVWCPETSGDFKILAWPLDGRPGGVIAVSTKGRIPLGGDFTLTPDGTRIILRGGDVLAVPARWAPR